MKRNQDAMLLAQEIRHGLDTVDRYRTKLGKIATKTRTDEVFKEQGQSLLRTARLALEEATQYIEDITS